MSKSPTREFYLGVFCLRHLDTSSRWQTAADAGFTGISVSWAEVLELRRQGISPREMRGRADSLGLQLTQLEYVSLMSEQSPTALATLYKEMANVANVLGCSDVTSVGKLDDGFPVPPPQDQPIDQRVIDNYGLLCDVCATAGLQATVEFMPYATSVDTLSRAVALMDSTSRGNAKLILDAIHFFRAGADWEGLSQLDISRVHTVQLNDGLQQRPTDSYVTESLTLRRCPGEGELDLRRFLQAVSDFTSPFTVEVLSSELSDMPPVEAADRMMTATSGVFAEVE